MQLFTDKHVGKAMPAWHERRGNGNGWEKRLREELRNGGRKLLEMNGCDDIAYRVLTSVAIN